MKKANLFERLAFWLARSPGVKNQAYNEAMLLLAAIFATAPLMWSYAFNSLLTVQNVYYLHQLSFFYSIVHLSSLFLYRFIPSLPLITNIFIGAGFIFQLHHSSATGGFFSSTIIWLTILPLIVGVISSLRHMMLWAVISTLGVMGEFVLTHYGLTTDEITTVGRIWGQLNIAFGYGFINICLIYAFRNNEARTMARLERKQKKIKSLFRILIHDISNPLTLIMFTNESLQKDLTPSQRDDLFKRIQRGCQTISSIINSTKAFEKSSQQKVFQLGPVKLVDCIDDCLDILKIQIENKKIVIDSQVAPEFTVLAQRDALTHQVMMNLLSNAIKFSHPEGTIEIKAYMQNEMAHILVKDHGIGMSEKVIKDLFDEGANNSSLGTIGEKGTGFGMPIAYMTLQRMHGDLLVTSSERSENSGTCFTVILERLED